MNSCSLEQACLQLALSPRTFVRPDVGIDGSNQAEQETSRLRDPCRNATQGGQTPRYVADMLKLNSPGNLAWAKTAVDLDRAIKSIT